jgi:hypothetical protein
LFKIANVFEAFGADGFATHTSLQDHLAPVASVGQSRHEVRGEVVLVKGRVSPVGLLSGEQGDEASSLHVHSLDYGAAHAAHSVGALVVGHHEDDLGLVGWFFALGELAGTTALGHRCDQSASRGKIKKLATAYRLPDAIQVLGHFVTPHGLDAGFVELLTFKSSRKVAAFTE